MEYSNNLAFFAFSRTKITFQWKSRFIMKASVTNFIVVLVIFGFIADTYNSSSIIAPTRKSGWKYAGFMGVQV